MMKEDLREVLPLWSLDRRGDGPCRTAVTREAIGVPSSRFIRPVPLEDPLGMAHDAPPRRVPDWAPTNHIAPLATIQRILAAMRLQCGRIRSRQQLKELDNHLLKDIGLRREAVDYTKPEMY